jgi:hypothetical protein
MFSGLFEIHITVSTDRPDDFIKLYIVAKKHDCKLIHTVSEEGSQYMISKFSNKDSYAKMLEKTRLYESLITEAGLNIIRSKIELMPSCIGWPKNKDEFENIKKFCPGTYFEFHAKATGTAGPYEGVRTIVNGLTQNEQNYAWASVNICGSAKDTIVSIRSYEYGNHTVYKDHVLGVLKTHGYRISDMIQQELAVYDTNVCLDRPGTGASKL